MYTDILILAHLVQRPYHGYELKREIEQNLGGSLTINNNQLYPALRRFEEMGAITREVERQTGKPDRHIYRLTDLGHDVLQAELRDFPAELARNDGEFFTRVAFFDLLDPETRRAILTTRQTTDQRELAYLEHAYTMLTGDSKARFVTHVLDFQRQRVQHELDWIARLMQEITK